VNPAAAGGRGARRWDRIAPHALTRWPGLAVRLTQGSGDAERWARTTGPDLLLVAGGDGTLHEVVNGLLAGSRNPLLVILATGSGNDAARNLGLPLDPVAAVRQLHDGPERHADLGQCHFREPDGSAVSRGFLNSLSLGISARASRIALRLRRIRPASLRYRLAGLAALLAGGRLAVEVREGAELLSEGPLLNLSVANGGGFGGGLLISPDSRPDDGVLELVSIRLGRLRAGIALAGLKGIQPAAGSGISVRALAGPVQLRAGPGLVPFELDGEHRVAAGPLEVGVLPGRLRVAGYPPRS
jgi:diacylglycerol kinase (ATP)